MSDLNVTVNNSPTVVTVQDFSTQINVAQGGTQGPPGASGVNTFSLTGFAGVANLNSLSGNLTLVGLGSVSVSTGLNIIQISGNNIPQGGNFVTGISVTGGSNLTGGLLFTGIGGVNVTQFGNVINFSGGTPGTTNNYINSGSGLFIFQTQIISGISGQFIQFPTNLGYNPLIVVTLQNNNIGDMFSYQISGTTPTGYWLNFSDVIDDTGYFVNTFAAPSTGTGLATIVIPNNGITQNVISPNNLNLISNTNNTGIIISGGNLNIYGNTSGIGPSNTGFSLVTDGVIFGGLSGLLGYPAGWLPIFLSGTLRYIPYF